MPAPEKAAAGQDTLDALVKRVSEEVDRPLIEEAVRCFGAGAYRAAYVMAWISVAESLRNKFSVMAGRNDSQAGSVLKEVGTREQQNQATDSYLLDQAGALGLITDEQEKKLSHLRDMRNPYAHPTGSGPTRNEVLATLEVAVGSVLSQPPLLRHAYARQLLSDLFEDRHFLADEDETVRDYARDVARRLHPEVAPYLLTELVSRSESFLGDPERGRERRRAGSFVAGFMEQLKPDLSEGRWDAVGLVQRQPVAASLLLCQPEVWPLLPDQAQSMILGHLTDPVKDESGRIIPRVVGLQQSRLLAKNSLLTQKQEEVLVAAVDAAPYQVLQQAGIPLSRIPLSRYIDRFLNDLRSHTWDRQNPAAGALIDVEPEKLSGLHSGVQVELGRNVLQAADGGSFRAADLIHTISARSERYPEDFVFGLLVETLVDEEGRFRLKRRYLDRVVEMSLAHESAEKLLGHARNLIRASEPKDTLVLDRLPDFKHGDDAYEEAIAILAGVKRTANHPDLVDRLIGSLKDAKPPDGETR